MDAREPKNAPDMTTGHVAEEAVPFRAAADPRRHDPEREARWEAWRTENARAITAWNDYVEEHGLPLARYRVF